MRTWKDQFFKNTMETLLRPVGEVEIQHEVASPDAQWADVWFEPHPALRPPRDSLGWLGKMSEQACLFESFSETPSELEIRGCLRKLLTKQHLRESTAAAEQKPWPALPKLWILAPSLRASHAQSYGLTSAEPWPEGIFISPPGFGLAWISLRDLAPVRETLLLRFLAIEGPVFQQAVKELIALPNDAPEKQAAKQILVARRFEVTKNAASNPEDEAWTMNYLELYEQWEREKLNEGMRAGKIKGKLEGMRVGKIKGKRVGKIEGKLEGKIEGKLEGKIEGKIEGFQQILLTMYKSRFGSVPDALELKIRSEKDEATLNSWCHLFMFDGADEIARKLAI